MEIEVKPNPMTKRLRLTVPLDSGKTFIFKDKTVLELIRYLSMKIIYQYGVIEHLEGENEKLLAVSIALFNEQETK